MWLPLAAIREQHLSLCVATYLYKQKRTIHLQQLLSINLTISNCLSINQSNSHYYTWLHGVIIAAIVGLVVDRGSVIVVSALDLLDVSWLRVDRGDRAARR